MSNLNPLQQYALGEDPPVSNRGVLVNGVYAVHGVIDTIGSNTTNFSDPNLNQFSKSLPIVVPDSYTHTVWTSDIVDDEVHNSYTLDFKFSTTTYINQVRFDILAVPCSWSLYRNSTLLTQGVVDQYDTTTYIHNNIELSETYLFDENNGLSLVIEKTVTGTQYQFSVQNFLAKLIVKDKSSITVNNVMVSGIQVQNRFNFVETYDPVIYDAGNILTSDVTDYWKCAPQPVGDAVVYLVIDLGSLQSLNRLFIDPLYSGTVFNLYWSYDNVVWAPVQRDFKLRRGFYELPTVTTRYLKFEFTQLTPEPYQLPFNSIQKTIEVFPDWVDGYFVNLERAISTISNQSYSQSSAAARNVPYNTQITSDTLYGSAFNNLGDAAFGASPSINQSQASQSSTSITDPTISYKTLTQINNRGSVYSPVTDVAFMTRRFPIAAQHVYKQIVLQQTWHHAYFTGIKQLKIYNNNYNTQVDYPEFTDYLMSSGTNTIVNVASSTATFRTPSIVSTASGVTVSGGGWSASSNDRLITKNLQTFTLYDSFKLAMLSSQWAGLLTPQQTTLQSSNPTSLAELQIVTSSGMTVQSIPSYSEKYSIYELTPSGGLARNYSYIRSGSAGGQNLLTTAQANFTYPGGWSATTSGGVTDTTITTSPKTATITFASGNGTTITYSGTNGFVAGNIVTITGIVPPAYNLVNATIATATASGFTVKNSGTGTYTSGGIATNKSYISLGSLPTEQWNPALGETNYGAGTFGATTTLGLVTNTRYTFLVSVSGTTGSTVTVNVAYSGTANVGGTPTASGTTFSQTFTVTGISGIVYTTDKPSWASQVNFSLTNTGTDVYSKASFAVGSGTIWASPLITSGMRMSAMARIYLPNTNNGDYRCSLYSGTTELAYRQYSNLPTKTWLDLEVPFTLVSGYYSYDRYNVQVTQNNGGGEKYRIALLGIFFNPIALEYCSDGTGVNWNWVTAGVNDPYTSINLRSPSNQLQLRATALQDNSTISAISVIPGYTQSPLYSTTTVDYLGDPKTNELSWRRTPAQRPLFQLGDELYPPEYDQTVMMGIQYPFKLN